MKVLFFSIFFILSFNSFSSYKGIESLTFSHEQVLNHQFQSERFAEIGRSCLRDYQETHLSFYQNHCVTKRTGFFRRRKKTYCLSKYYGERRYSKKEGERRSDGRKLTYLGSELKKYGFPIEWMYQMEPTSCVGMAMDCLKKAFIQTGQEESWRTVRRFTVLNGVGGTALQFALQRLGWKVFYWNPASKETLIERARAWDREEKNWGSKGYHEYRYYNVTRKGRYWYNPVDDHNALVGFEKTPPARLIGVPFWIGIANTGYHVFPGTAQEVVEAHSTRSITSVDNLEFSSFNPLAGEGPRWTRSEKYRSGLIAIPPQF